jgi:hypothetical protein
MQLRDRARASLDATLRRRLRWLVTFVGFPLGGFVAELIGPVDSAGAAIAGGAVTGLVIGSVQAWALRPEGIRPAPWIASTATGFAVGLGLGATLVDYGTSAGELALQGAVCGVGVGFAQALVLRPRLHAAAFLWTPALAGIWALGWVITSAIGVDVEEQYTVFGSSGAIVVTLATMVLPFALARRAPRSAT